MPCDGPRALGFLVGPWSLPSPKLLPQIKNELTPTQKNAFSCLLFELISSKATPTIIGTDRRNPNM
jgi:hypothetical protein